MPGVQSRTGVTVDAFYEQFRNMESTGGTLGKNATIINNTTAKTILETSPSNNIDAHMIKNTEWGATAYLSQSVFGKGTVDIAQNSSYYTGGAIGLAGLINRVRQSTTQNIYGVFDMSGGAWDYTTGIYSLASNTTNIQYTLNSGKKYRDLYTSSTGKPGDATTETSKWYYDSDKSVYSVYPVFKRGDTWGVYTSPGVFAYGSRYGGHRILRGHFLSSSFGVRCRSVGAVKCVS